MRREQLFEAIGDINLELLEKSERRATPWKYLVNAAACLAVVGMVTCWAMFGGTLFMDTRLSESAIQENWNGSEPGVDMEAPRTEDASLAIGWTEPGSAVEGSGEIDFVEPGPLTNVAAYIALPDGYFFYTMTAQDLGGLWGMEELDSLNGYALRGQVTYDGQGEPWLVTVDGQSDTGDFHLELAPDHLPYTCCYVDLEPYEQVYNGTTITALYLGDGYYLEALYTGEETVGFRADSADPAILEELAKLSFGEDGGLWLSQLHTDQVPEWRSQRLDETAARAEEGFLAYLPTTVPERFHFRMAYRELGQDRDYLTVDYECDDLYSYLEVMVRKIYDDLTVYDVSQPETYDRTRYRDTWNNGVFLREDLTEQIVATQCTAYDQGTPYCNLQVLYSDGTLVELTGGITAQEAWDILSQIPTA